MPTPRKKTSGFSSSPVDSSVSEEEIVSVPETPQEQPFVEQSIVPTEDTGPRFVEENKSEAPVVESPKEAVPQAAPPVAHPPKRNPRNIPRFSRHSAK